MLLLVTFLSFAQNKFESGYYIDNSGIKRECFIKNYEWKNNPKNIEIKNTMDDEKINRKELDDIKEFGINNKSKFIKATVKIDESSQNINVLTNNPNPMFAEKTVFLKVLVEGKSNLYYFENEDYDRFFFTVNDKIEQLVYKQYNTPEGNIKINEAYKQQLFVNFKCNNDQKSIIALKYRNTDLYNYFIKTNSCITGITNTKEIIDRKLETNFKINLLLNNININYHIPNSNIRGYYNQGRKNIIGFGFETEVILPYYHNNWSLIFDPSFIKYKESIKIYQSGVINPDNTFYNNSYTLRFPIGLRRYFKLDKNNVFFTNISLSMNFSRTNLYNYNPFNNATTILAEDEMILSNNAAFGVGYQYKKYSAELKLNSKTIFSKAILNGVESSFSQISLKLGYKLF